MPEDSGKQDDTQKSASSNAQARIVWDDSNMRSSYANVANVAGGREEIVLLFGMNQSWHSGQKEIKVQLADRIGMSPSAAKRFAQTLNKVLSDYEARYGKLDTGPQKS